MEDILIMRCRIEEVEVDVFGTLGQGDKVRRLEVHVPGQTTLVLPVDVARRLCNALNWCFDTPMSEETLTLHHDVKKPDGEGP